MLDIAGAAARRWPWFRRSTNRLFYQFLARLDTAGEVTLMNYGYVPSAPDEPEIPLDAADEKNRLCLQLYHYLASGVDLRGKDALEIGSGRGGGAAWVRKTFSPGSMTGVDYSERAVAFCRKTHRADGLSFVYGDAEALPFEDERFDVALNLESSHCYGSMPKFLAEVRRVLKPGGVLSWADFRSPDDVPGVDAGLSACGFHTVKSAVITPNVLAAMSRQGERYRALIDRMVPAFARGLFYHYAGVEGTGVLDSLRDGTLVYVHRIAVRA